MRLKALVIAVAAAATPAFAQVATDGSAGARLTLAGPRFDINERLGTRVGQNLLHSFSIFNIRTGETAAFTGNQFTSNIIARITGGSASTIDGAVRVEIGGANLFLVNPSGLVFGPGASIDVPAAFYASTAQAIRLADGSVIDMRTATPPVSLTAAAPSAFGFESAGAAIVLNGAQLRQREGQRLALVGGDVSLARSAAGRIAVVAAPSGAVDVVATRGAGTVAIGDRLDPSGFSAMGNVTVSGGSTLSASEGTGRLGGGTVYVRGGDVTLDRAQVESRTRFANGRGIDIGATGRLAIDASNVVAVTTGGGNAGYLRLSGQDIAISGGSLVDTSCDPGCTTGRGGDLSISAGNGLTITGSNPNLPTFVVSNSFGGGPTGPIFITTGGALSMSGTSFIQGIALDNGDGSSITLRTGSIDLSGGAQVDASTRGPGRGGTITVENRGDIRLSGTRLDPTQIDPDTKLPLVLPSGFFANAAGSGDAGSVVVSTASLQVLSGGEISSTAQKGSTGRGGNVTISATGLVRVAGTNGSGKSSGIVSNAFSVGDGGAVDVSADRIEVADDGRIQSQAQSRGNAGSVRVRARQATLSSGGQIASSTFAPLGGGNGGRVEVSVADTLTITGVSNSNSSVPSGIFASTRGDGAGGDIAVQAASAQVLAGGAIDTSTYASGRGGRIDVRATSLLRIDGTNAFGVSSAISSNAGGSGNAGEIFLESPRVEVAGKGSIQAATTAAGNAGAIRIRGGELEIRSGGTVTAQTNSSGNGGAIDVTLAGTLSIVGDGSTFTFPGPQGLPDIVVPATGLFAQTTNSGTGGTVRVAAQDVQVAGGSILGGTFRGSISTGGGQGNAGSVVLDATRNLTVSDGGIVTTFSQFAGGNAGNIAIHVGDTMRVEAGGRVSTEARRSDGGDIAIRVDNVAILDNAAITTAVGTGQGAGGNIRIETPTLSMNRSGISANAFGGPGGNIDIATQNLFKSANSTVTASSVLSVDGTINFESPALDPTGELLAPQPVFLDAGAILSGRCGARLAGRASSLVILPRPLEANYPDDLRPVLDGRTTGFLTRPAPRACAPEAPATLAQVVR